MPRPPKTTLKLVDDAATQEAFLTAIDNQHALAVRTADKMRKIVLVEGGPDRKTLITDFKSSEVDPQIQLLLMARDAFERAEESTERTVMFKEMRAILQSVSDKCERVLDFAMKERHHQEQMQLAREKIEAASKSKAEKDIEAELEALAGEAGGE